MEGYFIRRSILGYFLMFKREDGQVEVVAHVDLDDLRLNIINLSDGATNEV